MHRAEELLTLLKENNKITEEQFGEFLKLSQQQKLEDILVSRGILESESIVKLKAELYNFPYQDLIETQIEKDALNIITSEVAENYQVICFEKKDNSILVGITDIDNFQAMEAVNFIAKKAGYKVEYYLISELSFRKAFKQYEVFKQEIYSALEKKETEEALIAEEKDDDIEDIGVMVKSAPVSKIVSVIIRNAVEGKASDIHIEPLKKDTKVRYRIDGILHTSLILPKKVHDSIVGRIKVLAKLKLDETRLPQDGRIRLIIDKKEVDFRVSVLPLVGDEKVVMRILDTTQKAPELSDLGYSKRISRIIYENIKHTNGMFLVAGPTGSGKSTTLFSILHKLNQDKVNIVTLEDPVEYFIKGVNQSQIRPEIGFTFANGLRSFLRQDPDIIMVGEIRDSETAKLAINAGLTGHFVLSTLHTNSALGAVPRLLDMNIEPFLLASTLNAVVAQRLVRKICRFCQEPIKLPNKILKNIKNKIRELPSEIIKEELSHLKSFNDVIFYHGKGCGHCGNSGFSGRIAIAEIIEINEDLRKIIMHDARIVEEDDVRKTQTYTTMYQDGIIKVLQGYTTIDEVLRVIQS